jgi:hypothetical protein
MLDITWSNTKNRCTLLNPSHAPFENHRSKRYYRSVILPYYIAGVEDNETMVKKVEGVKPPQRLPSSLTD